MRLQPNAVQCPLCAERYPPLRVDRAYVLTIFPLNKRMLVPASTFLQPMALQTHGQGMSMSSQDKSNMGVLHRQGTGRNPHTAMGKDTFHQTIDFEVPLNGVGG